MGQLQIRGCMQIMIITRQYGAAVKRRFHNFYGRKEIKLLH